MSKKYMTQPEAEWWARSITKLIVGKPLLIVVSHEGRNWVPEIRLDMAREVRTLHLDHGSWVSISTKDYLYCEIVDVRIQSDDLSVRVSAVAPSGHKLHWAFKVLDDTWKDSELFRELAHQSCRRPWKKLEEKMEVTV
jgi:hypothetical protein